mgnify:CR=1 FL=1|jgi:hypothetical protein
MQDYITILDALLEKECYIMDFLPKTIPQDSAGQFFEVEHFLLNSDKHIGVKNKFVGVILKLMCYFEMSVSWNGWIEKPSPKLVDDAVSEIMSNHSGSLNCLFRDINTLLVFDWDCLNLTIYNPPEEVQHIFEEIAFSEGLFWRKSPQTTSL